MTLIDVFIKKLNEINNKQIDFNNRDFWEEFQMLDGIDNENIRQMVSDEFSKMAIHLFEHHYPDFVYGIVFPMIRRACTNGGITHYYTPERMCDMIENTFIPFTKSIEKWDNMIDNEAEYCRFFSKLFSKNG